MLIIGEVIDRDANAWEIEGKTGTAYSVYLRPASIRDAADRVRCSFEQYQSYVVGRSYEIPVSVMVDARAGQRPKLSIVQVPDSIAQDRDEYQGAL